MAEAPLCCKNRPVGASHPRPFTLLTAGVAGGWFLQVGRAHVHLERPTPTLLSHPAEVLFWHSGSVEPMIKETDRRF